MIKDLGYGISVRDDSVRNHHMIREMVEDISFPWYFNRTSIDQKDEVNHQNKYQFTHSMIQDGEVTANLIMPSRNSEILRCFDEIPEFNNMRLVRAKFNLTVPYKQRTMPLPHRDYTNPRAVSYLYYVNTSDGQTTFYINRWKRIKVEPKQGRIVRFPGNLRHGSGLPYEYDRRIVFNLLFIPYGE